MIIEFRNVEGAVVSRHNLGGNSIECAAATQQQYEQRMINLGAPVELAKRAAARHMRALANPVKSLQQRIADANAVVAADRAAGLLLDETDADFRKRMLAAAARLMS